MLVEAGSGHTAGPLGSADIFTALYFHLLEKNDKFILSCGHYCPARYAAMARAGELPLTELKTLRKLGSRLQGHPDRKLFPELLTTSGPLGCGLAQAAGMAYAARMDDKKLRIYCLTSDGEHDTGNHWEAVLFAGKNRLDNLVCLIDRNNIQIDGFTEEIMPLEPLRQKYEAFNWCVLHVDGHNIEEIIDAVYHSRGVRGKPTAIICHTIPGKGVSFIENKPEWHGKVPSPAEAKRALKELTKQ